jgi:3-dehydroquinate synthase
MNPSHQFESRNYPVYIGPEAWDTLNSYFGSFNYSKVFVLVDENTRKLCLSLAVRKVPLLANVKVLSIKSGEQAKTVENCNKLWRMLMQGGADTRSVLINLGGGVISDMGGFVAATFKRGIAFVNIPTTLLAQVDASVGSKVGVDFDGIKNQIGLFADPQAVFILPEFLSTLPQRHLLSGYAEMMKHAIIGDSDFWSVILSQGFEPKDGWEDLIGQSVGIKQKVVKFDPFEQGLRKVLNFGHTIGHGVESYSLLHDINPMLHGEAVAIGMICEAFISCKLCGLPEEELIQIVEFINMHFALQPLSSEAAIEVLEIIKHDKKSENGKCRMTLLPHIGKAIINQECTQDLIIDSLHFYVNSFDLVGLTC